MAPGARTAGIGLAQTFGGPIPRKDRLMSVELIISVGLLGWLVVGIVLMGLDIW